MYLQKNKLFFTWPLGKNSELDKLFFPPFSKVFYLDS